MKDVIVYLKNYIEKNLNEKDGGRWEYIIHPVIRDTINSLSENESQIFSVEILNWKEEILYHLADEIIFSENKYIDKDYLYCIIFSKTSNRENGEYLLQNFTAIFEDLDSSKCTLKFLENLKEKVVEISKIPISESDDFNKLYEEKIAEINGK